MSYAGTPSIAHSKLPALSSFFIRSHKSLYDIWRYLMATWPNVTCIKLWLHKNLYEQFCTQCQILSIRAQVVPKQESSQPHFTINSSLTQQSSLFLPPKCCSRHQGTECCVVRESATETPRQVSNTSGPIGLRAVRTMQLAERHLMHASRDRIVERLCLPKECLRYPRMAATTVANSNEKGVRPPEGGPRFVQVRRSSMDKHMGTTSEDLLDGFPTWLARDR